MFHLVCRPWGLEEEGSWEPSELHRSKPHTMEALTRPRPAAEAGLASTA